MKKLTIAALALAIAFVSCSENKKTDKETTKASSVDSPSTAKTNTAPVIDLSKNNNIDSFLNNLSMAVASKDKEMVAQMTNFPFNDEWGDNKENGATALGSKTKEEFLSKYDSVFTPALIAAIQTKIHRGWKDQNAIPDVIEKGEYLIETEHTGSRDYMLGIKKVGGVYKLYAMKFYS